MTVVVYVAGVTGKMRDILSHRFVDPGLFDEDDTTQVTHDTDHHMILITT